MPCERVQDIPHIMLGVALADVVLLVGTVDVVFGSVDLYATQDDTSLVPGTLGGARLSPSPDHHHISTPSMWGKETIFPPQRVFRGWPHVPWIRGVPEYTKRGPFWTPFLGYFPLVMVERA